MNKILSQKLKDKKYPKWMTLTKRLSSSIILGSYIKNRAIMETMQPSRVSTWKWRQDKLLDSWVLMVQEKLLLFRCLLEWSLLIMVMLGLEATI